MLDKTFVFLLEIIGTVAFAVSGADVAIQKKMDILGVAILGMTASVGGGIMRDLILGITPPSAFTNPVYAVVSIVTSILYFLPAIQNMLKKDRKVYASVLNIMDTIGLAVSSVLGVETAVNTVSGDNIFLAVFVGTITGVGGGVLRDIFCGNTPYIFEKDFYATAAILGSSACFLLCPHLGLSNSMAAGAILIIVLRVLAIRFRWHLPKA